jgi:hypothetical protein
MSSRPYMSSSSSSKAPTPKAWNKTKSSDYVGFEVASVASYGERCS